MPNRYFLGLLLFGTFLLIGCGGSSSPAANELMADKKSVQFGSVPLGHSILSSIALTNPATDGSLVTVSQIRISGTGFKLGYTPKLPFVLGAGKSVSLGIEFSPLTGGTVNGTASVVSDATNSDLPLSLLGSGLSSVQPGSGGILHVSAPAISFGNVALNSSKTIAGSLSATGSPVTISTVDETGEGYSLSGITFPITIPVGQSIPFKVTFVPDQVGTSSGNLSFISSTGVSTPVALSGAVAGQALLNQPSIHRVALSWTPDNSPIVGYNVYRSSQRSGPYSKLTQTTLPSAEFADTNAQSGATYYYVATSVDANHAESNYSNPVMAAIP